MTLHELEGDRKVGLYFILTVEWHRWWARSLKSVHYEWPFLRLLARGGQKSFRIREAGL